MESHLKDIYELLASGQKVVLARIIKQAGSTPRSTGTRCLILEDGSIQGTVGGGSLEHQVMEKAGEVFNTGESAVIHFQLTGEDAAETEMICGGMADVLLEPVFPGCAAAVEVFRKINALAARGRRGALLTLASEGIGYGDESCRLLIEEDGARTGGIRDVSGDDDQGFDALLLNRKPGLTEFEKGGPAIFVEPVKPNDVLYLFGGGHVSTFVASLATMVGFHVVVIDDREEFANKERFPTAGELIVSPYQDVFDQLSLTPSSYIAIITRGHIHDRDVLREALKGSSVYIGMIGSRRKRAIIYQSLMEEGVSNQQLSQVHSPIGMDIGAETPEEIAVSIVGELIRARAPKRKKKLA